MVKPARDFIWLGGRPALDLCNTVRGDGTDLLVEPADVVDWLTAGGFGEPDCHPEATDLERIHALRGELRSAFVVHDAGAIAELVSDWLATTPGRLTIDRSTLRSSFCPEVSTCRCLLVPALLDALDLARDEITRVRECASETCSVVYLDSSRNRSRRWCSMEICGSRAKAHAYYTRRRSGRDAEGDGPRAD
jgi:predicted RNA-binding Zn ribbon-like protein